MNSFTQFVLDAFKQSPRLLAIARQIRIGPRHMGTIDNHQAYNVAAAIFTVIMLALTRNSISPNDIDVTLSLFVTFSVSIVFVVAGFFANLAETTIDETGAESQKAGIDLANKWTTYFIFNFALIIPTYWALNYFHFLYDGSAFSAMLNLQSDGLINWELSAYAACFFAAIISSSILFMMAGRGNKIVDPSPVWQWYFLLTTVICSLTFYFVTFFWNK